MGTLTVGEGNSLDSARPGRPPLGHHGPSARCTPGERGRRGEGRSHSGGHSLGGGGGSSSPDGQGRSPPRPTGQGRSELVGNRRACPGRLGSQPFPSRRADWQAQRQMMIFISYVNLHLYHVNLNPKP